jgi:hypothetical protein
MELCKKNVADREWECGIKNENYFFALELTIFIRIGVEEF